MEKKHYTGPIRNISPAEYYRRVSEISNLCKQVDVFEFEGRFFSGNIIATIKAFLHENPSKSFFVWLIDNGLEVKNVIIKTE